MKIVASSECMLLLQILIRRFCYFIEKFYHSYDGHGGKEVADYVVKALHHNLQAYLKASSAHVCKFSYSI